MKKYFMFATVAIASLFASCSNSDDFVAPQVTSEDVASGDALVPIQIGVGSHIDVSTRSTGTVGSVGAAGQQNLWYGQKINVFMTKKDDSNNPTMELAVNNGAALYNNELMVTPGTGALIPTNDIPTYDVPQSTGQAMLVDGSIKYYPINGNFDFFAYHGDDAVTTAPTLNTAGDAFEVAFTINGSQDLMSTKAVLSEAQTGIMNALGEPNKNRYYSAFAARRNVQPYLVFDHLLTRLQFNIKAGNKETAGVEDCYQEIADPTNIISKTTYDDMLTQEDYTLFNYLLISDGTTTISPATYAGYDAATQALYTPQYSADGGVNLISATAYAALYADAAAKAAAYTPVTRQVDPSDPNYTGVKVKAIEVYSKKSGTLLTAWTAADPQRLTWDAADATTTGWLSLQQHTGATIGYIKNDRSDYIDAASWPGTLTAQQQTQYTPFQNPNTDLVALTQVAPGYYADGADDAEKFYYKQVGEALLVSLPISSTTYADADDYEMRITLTQRVKTNWNGTIGDYTIDPIPVTIPKPDGGFKANTSYNVNLTLYGVERIDVYTTITPWEAGAPIDLEIE